MNCKLEICVFQLCQETPVERSFDLPQRGHDPQGENYCSKDTYKNKKKNILSGITCEEHDKAILRELELAH